MSSLTAAPLRPAPNDGGPARLVTGPVALRRWAVAALVANIGIVLTGGLVRLTASGLGCPTWPRCTEESYVPHPAYGIHGVIEFGNRLLTFVLVVVMVLTLVTAIRVRVSGSVPIGRGAGVRWPAIALLAGIPAQAVIGGISVLTELNPYVVAFHFLASMLLISLSVLLVLRSRALADLAAGRPAAAPRTPTPAQRALVIITYVVAWLVLWLGTVVTGSGPHSGDLTAKRTGLDPELISHVHAVGAYVLVGLTVVGVCWLRSRSVAVLLAVEGFQALVGLAQFNLGLPIWLVLLHLLGASLTAAAGTFYLLRPTWREVLVNRT